MEDLSQKIIEKQQELQYLQLLNSQIVTMTTNFEQLQDNMSDLSNGTESISEIMMNWQKILKSISLASLSLRKYSIDDYEDFESKAPHLEMPLPETLVRIKIDDDDDDDENVHG